MRSKELLAVIAATFASGTNHSASAAVDYAEAILTEVDKRYPDPPPPVWNPASQENQ